MNLHLPGDESEAKHVVSLFLQHSLSKTNNVSISKRNLHPGLETQSSLQVDKKQEHSYLQSSVINPEKTPKEEGEADRTVWSLI